MIRHLEIVAFTGYTGLNIYQDTPHLLHIDNNKIVTNLLKVLWHYTNRKSEFKNIKSIIILTQTNCLLLC